MIPMLLKVTKNRYMKKDNIQGILFIILAGFFFSLMTVFVRLSGDLPTMEKAFFRNAVAAVVSVILLIRAKEKFYIKKGSLFGLFMRSICGSIGLICNFYAIDRIGLADANMLNKLSPFFAIIMSIFVLKEKANKVEWAAVIFAFAGALLVIKPSFNITSFYGFVGLCGGMGAGIAYSFVRLLGKRGERGIIIVMFFSFFSCLLTLPFFILQYEPMTMKQLLCLLLAGTAATGGQLSITKAYTKAPAKEISVFDYSQILFAALWGNLLFSEVPDALSITGYVLIIGVAIFKWRYSMNKAKEKETSM